MASQRYSEEPNLAHAFSVLVVVHTVLYLPVYWHLVQAWESMPQCSHGWFILPISASLCFLKRRYLQGRSYPMAYGGCLLTFIGLVLYLASFVYESDSMGYLSYMITLAGLLVSIFGALILKILWFPLLFLLFMFPLPDFLYLQLTGPLKLFASRASAWIFSVVGVPVLQEGNIIQLPNLQLNVVEACSGMQSLVSYVMLGFLLAYFLTAPLWKKLALIAATVPVALLNNIMRITGTGFLGEVFGQKAISGMYHELFGVIIFAVGFGVLVGIYLLISGSRTGIIVSAAHSGHVPMGEKCR